MGLADGTVGDEDEDLGDQQCFCKFYFAYSFFIGIACAQQCVTSATSESSKDLLRRGRVGRGRGLLILRAEADVRVSTEVFGAFPCCCWVRAFEMRIFVEFFHGTFKASRLFRYKFGVKCFSVGSPIFFCIRCRMDT